MAWWKSLKVIIDPGPYYDHVEFLSPAFVFTKNDRTWIWHGSQVDLKKITAIHLALSKTVVAANELSNWNNLSYVKFNDCASAKSSSELPPIEKIMYSAKNILDGNAKTAWCADKANDGESVFLEFTSKQDIFASCLREYCSIEGLMLTTGYIKNQNIYSSNNRIKKIALSDCSGKFRNVYSIQPDEDFRFGAILIKNEIPERAWNKFIKGYRAKHGNNYTHPDYKKAPKPKMDFIRQTSCFRIEILETEGSEANDTCISEAALVINCF